MTPAEAAALLTWASTYDNRTVTPEAATAWAEALDERMTIQDAKTVITRHYATTRDWIMPVDINAGNRRIRHQRIDTAGTIELPDGLPGDDSATYSRTWLRAIGDGHSPDEAHRITQSRMNFTPRAFIPGPPPENVRAMLDDLAKSKRIDREADDDNDEPTAD